MIDKILKARLSQLKEFKLKAEQHIELLQVRVSELSDEEILLNSLLNLYHVYNPDPTAVNDKTIDDIIKENPKRTRFTVSSELADALAKLEEHKQEKLEHQVKAELELKLRKELEPEVRQDLRKELSETVSQVQRLVSIVSDNFKVTTSEEKPAKIITKKEKVKKEVIQEVVTGELIKGNNQADHKKIQQEITKFILDNGNRYMGLNDISNYLEEKHPYLKKIWNTVKKGANNCLARMDNLDIKKSENGKINLYRIKE